MISKIIFVDLDGKFNKWIEFYFKDIKGIECLTQRVENYKPTSTERVAYVSPLNNVGMMDSGIDLAYNLLLFRHINTVVKKRIIESCFYLKQKKFNIPPEMVASSPYISVGSSLLIPIEGSLHYLKMALKA